MVRNASREEPSGSLLVDHLRQHDTPLGIRTVHVEPAVVEMVVEGDDAELLDVFLHLRLAQLAAEESLPQRMSAARLGLVNLLDPTQGILVLRVHGDLHLAAWSAGYSARSRSR